MNFNSYFWHMACEEPKFESVVFVVKSDHKYYFSAVSGVSALRWYASILLNLEICVICVHQN
jgi:hypothetical protein